MKCPNCGLFNPDSAQRCDCGFDFKTATIQASYLTAKQAKQVGRAKDSVLTPIQWCVVCLLGFGLASSVLLPAVRSSGPIDGHGADGFAVFGLFFLGTIATVVTVGLGALLTTTRWNRILGSFLLAAGIGVGIALCLGWILA
jgi:hypothetical protein